MPAALAGMQDTVEQTVPEHIVEHTVDVPVPQDMEGIDTEYVAAAPAVTRRRRTGKCTASSPAVARATPGPVIENVAPVIEFMSPAGVHAAPTPVIEHAVPTAAYAAPSPVIACSSDRFRGASDRVYVIMCSTSPRDRACIVLTCRGLCNAYSCD